jgi:PPOX class probable FMN-dependent enzyme
MTAADEYQPIDMARIREIVGYPAAFIADKKTDHITEFAHRFIGHSTFFVLASVGADGGVDASPKGDPPGSVRVLDPWTIAIPDRPGNRGIDTFTNLVDRPGVGLIMLVPGMTETLRVNGDAFVTDDPDLLGQLSAGGKPALLATVVRVREVYFQCGKALIRSHLWDPNLALADALLTGGDYYQLAIADMGRKLAAAGLSPDTLADLAAHEYRTKLF